jgi:hypothetical protein
MKLLDELVYALYLPSLKLRRASGLTPAERDLVESSFVPRGGTTADKDRATK